MKRRKINKNIAPDTAKNIIIDDLKGVFSMVCIEKGLVPVFDCIPKGTCEETIIFATCPEFVDEFSCRLYSREAKLSQYLVYIDDKREFYKDFQTI